MIYERQKKLAPALLDTILQVIKEYSRVFLVHKNELYSIIMNVLVFIYYLGRLNSRSVANITPPIVSVM